MKNKSARAAALLSVSASLLATAAQAAPESVTECIPMFQSEGKVTIYALCNAAAVNTPTRPLCCGPWALP